MLTDKHGRIHNYLRVSVTDRCNLRCAYCMPTEGVQLKPHDEILTLEETLRLAKLFVSNGISKIRLTGGEPLVRSNLIWLVGELARVKGLETLAMTTNGTMLKENARAFRDAGLSRLNISLDTLRPERFLAITGRDALSTVLSGIGAALTAGFEEMKLNVVVMAGVNDDEVTDFVEFIRDKPLHVRFIEFMPFPGNSWGNEKFIPWRKLLQSLQNRYKMKPDDNDGTAVARTYKIQDVRGTVSFISPLSEDFCLGCNRLRLTADGSLKSCLLYPAEVSLKGLLRSGADDLKLLEVIQSALDKKHIVHPPTDELLQLDNRCMSTIGG